MEAHKNNNKEHLEFDTDFLNIAQSKVKKAKCLHCGNIQDFNLKNCQNCSQEMPAAVDRKSKDPNFVLVDNKPNKPTKSWIDKKAALWTVGVILVLSIWGAISDNKSGSSSSSSNYSTEGNGQYSCSSYDSSHADSLLPTFTKASLDMDEQSLTNRATALKALGNKIDNTTADENDQNSLDSYNKMVNDYNAELEAIKRDSKLHDQKVDQFNAATEAYNNYLQANCTKRY